MLTVYCSYFLLPTTPPTLPQSSNISIKSKLLFWDLLHLAASDGEQVRDNYSFYCLPRDIAHNPQQVTMSIPQENWTRKWDIFCFVFAQILRRRRRLEHATKSAFNEHRILAGKIDFKDFLLNKELVWHLRRRKFRDSELPFKSIDKGGSFEWMSLRLFRVFFFFLNYLSLEGPLQSDHALGILRISFA